MFTLLFSTCGVMDEPDYYTQVVSLENTITTYYDSNGDSWICKELTILDDNKSRKLMYPIEYFGKIKVGTKITWECHRVLSYDNGKQIYIDWENTKRQ